MNELSSTKFIVTLVTLICLLLTGKLGVNTEVALAMAGVSMTFLGGQSWIDKHKAAACPPAPQPQGGTPNGA